MNATRPPLRFEPAFEQPEADEAKTTAELIETLRHIGEKVLADSGHALRSVHAKNHGLLQGELRVLPGLPPELAQGLFAEARTYPVVMRLSTSPGDLLDDNISTPRGLGVKVMNVAGARVAGSDDAATQDFLLVDGPAFLVPDAKKFLGNLKLLAATTDKAQGLKKVLSAVLQGTEKLVEAAGGKSGTLIALGGHARTNPLGETYFTQVPMLYGHYMAKLSIAPASSDLQALKDAPVDLDDKPDGLRQAVGAFFASQGGEWEVRVQLCTDLESMPIEDASVEWPQAQSPFRAVARITVPAGGAWTDERRTTADDRLAFSPWHSLAAHRPLGSIMRVRQAVYEASMQFRATSNGCPIHEPRTLAELGV